MSDRESVIRCFIEADAICFDVDSTVCTGEGIDELAAFCRKEEQVKEMYGCISTDQCHFISATALALSFYPQDCQGNVWCTGLQRCFEAKISKF